MKIMKNKNFIFLLFLTISSYAQTDTISNCNCNNDSVQLFITYEKDATFPGGEDSLALYLSENIKYPETAVKLKLEDRVYVQFCVRSSGKITDIKILKGKFDILNKEAIRLVSEMPNWNPTISRGEPICTPNMIPVNFRLTNSKMKKRRRLNDRTCCF